MLKSAIVIDSWKLKIFKKTLNEAGYEFDEHPGVTPTTLCLIVETDCPGNLHKFVTKANPLAANSKAN